MTDGSVNLKVFISYSRKDGLDFVEQLATALEVVGIETLIDRHDIPGGEDWRKRIGGMIAEADSVVFVITPGSVTSEICEREIAQTDQQGKKLVPVVPSRLDGVLVPERMNSLNYIFFYPDTAVPGSGFGKGFADLCAALRTDLDWVRAHTRYGQRAAEWLSGNRAANRLLSGNDVTLAKTWMDKRQTGAPEIIDIVREYIDTSEQAEIERRNIERKRLQEKEEDLVKMEAAYEDKKLAQQQQANAQARAKKYLVGGTVLAVALAAFGSWMWVNAIRSETRAKGLSDLVGWIGNEMLGEKREATEEQKLAMIDLCNDAIEITKTIAGNAETGVRKADRDRFWELYYGPLYAVELFQKYYSNDGKSKIETSMVRFGRILAKEKEGNLVNAAEDVETACNGFKAWLKQRPSVTNSD